MNKCCVVAKSKLWQESGGWGWEFMLASLGPQVPRTEAHSIDHLL